jgi:alpha-tubulin suppressor-like RCC1 family protein
LWCWGANSQGELGDNTITSRSSPVQTVTFGTNWIQAACGNTTTVAIKNDGTLWTWGYNATGQLGDNTTTKKSSPVQTVAYGTLWRQVAGSQYHIAAIKTDGTLWTWGQNDYGQLGDNTLVNKSSPVQTVTFATNWKQVDAGSSNTAATKTDGTLWTWGINSNGQLGDNTTTKKSSPVQTLAFGYKWKQVSCVSGSTFAIQTEADANLIDQASAATNILGGDAGQIPYNTGSGSTSFLAAGTVGQVLQSNGTAAPSWSSAPSAASNIFLSTNFGGL